MSYVIYFLYTFSSCLMVLRRIRLIAPINITSELHPDVDFFSFRVCKCSVYSLIFVWNVFVNVRILPGLDMKLDMCQTDIRL